MTLWKPYMLGAGVIEYDARVGKTVVSGKVSQWDDQIGSVDATQATSGSRPTDGTNVITFNSGTFLTAAMPQANNLEGAYAVCRLSAYNGGYGGFFHSAGNGGRFFYFQGSATNQLKFIVDRQAFTAGPQQTVTVPNTSNPYIVGFGATWPAQEFSFNGTVYNPTPVGDSGFNVFNTEIGGASTIDFHMHHIVRTPQKLSATARRILEGYFAHSWDETLGGTALRDGLASDHPFKTVPPQAPITFGMIAGYTFDLGNANDSVGTAHGTAVASPTFSVNTVTFNGTSQAIQFTTDFGRKNLPRAFSLWFKTTDSDGILLQQEGAGDVPTITLAGGKIRGYLYNGSGDTTIISPGTLNDGAWHHVVWQYDGTNCELFIDKVSAGTAASAVSEGWWTETYLAWGTSRTAANEWFAGSIDDFYVYDRALDAQDVAVLYAVSSHAPTVLDGIDVQMNIDISKPTSVVNVNTNPTKLNIADQSSYARDARTGFGNTAQHDPVTKSIRTYGGTAGSDAAIYLADNPVSAQFQCFIVSRRGAMASYATLLQYGAGYHHILKNTGSNAVGSYQSGFSGAGSLAWPADELHIIRVKNVAATGVQISLDGGALQTTTMVVDRSPLWLGNYMSGTQGWGDIHQAIFVPVGISEDDAQLIEGMLAWKWDRELLVNTLVPLLPSGHAYKSAEPTLEEPPSGSGPWVKHSGIWKQASVFVKHSGTWKAATVSVKSGGVWKAT